MQLGLVRIGCRTPWHLIISYPLTKTPRKVPFFTIPLLIISNPFFHGTITILNNLRVIVGIFYEEKDSFLGQDTVSLYVSI